MRLRKPIKYFLLLSIIGMVLALWHFGMKHRSDDPLSSADTIAAAPNIAYGLNVDSMILIKDKVKSNQNLSDILSKYKVDYKKIDHLARQTKHIFDVRKIRKGNNYTMIVTNDQQRTPAYFIYEISPVDYVVYDLTNPVHAHYGKKEVEIRVDTATGMITSSLWNAMTENGTDPNLANDLSEVYAWSIDFFGIQKNDFYKVIYENLYVDGERIGLGKILAATFNHAGADHHAIYFVQNGKGEFFDEKANSLRKSFLKAPLKFKRISSNFSHSRMHPVLKYRRPHLGVDYAADYGTPVVAIGDGVVESAKWSSGGGGNTIKIRHNSTFSTAYLHLSKFGVGIKAGSRVRQGQVIGYVGSSGLSTGPHLDFRFYRNGLPVDPLKVQSPPAEPVAEANRKQFEAEKEKWLTLLKNIRIVNPESLKIAMR